MQAHTGRRTASQPWAAGRQLDDDTQWTGPSTLECASMEGRRAVIDVQHYPTALQVCMMPGVSSWRRPARRTALTLSLGCHTSHGLLTPLLHARAPGHRTSAILHAMSPGASLCHSAG